MTEEATKKEVAFSNHLTTEWGPAGDPEVGSVCSKSPPVEELLDDLPAEHEENVSLREETDVSSIGADPMHSNPPRFDEEDWQSPQLTLADREPLLAETNLQNNQGEIKEPVEVNYNRTGLLILLACIVVTITLGATTDTSIPTTNITNYTVLELSTLQVKEDTLPPTNLGALPLPVATVSPIPGPLGAQPKNPPENMNHSQTVPTINSNMNTKNSTIDQNNTDDSLP